MLAAFGKTLSMDRGEEVENSLLRDESSDEVKTELTPRLNATSLAATAETALRDAKVREMLAAFRAEGPSALARYVAGGVWSSSNVTSTRVGEENGDSSTHKRAGECRFLDARRG